MAAEPLPAATNFSIASSSSSNTFPRNSSLAESLSFLAMLLIISKNCCWRK